MLCLQTRRSDECLACLKLFYEGRDGFILLNLTGFENYFAQYRTIKWI